MIAGSDDIHTSGEDFLGRLGRDAGPPAEFSPLAMTTSISAGGEVRARGS
jgi:hypothetical protein